MKFTGPLFLWRRKAGESAVYLFPKPQVRYTFSKASRQGKRYFRDTLSRFYFCISPSDVLGPTYSSARATAAHCKEGWRDGGRAVLHCDTALLSRGPFENTPCTTSGYTKAAHPSSMTLPKNPCQRCTVTPIVCQSGRTVHKWKFCFTLSCILCFIPYWWDWFSRVASQGLSAH